MALLMSPWLPAQSSFVWAAGPTSEERGVADMTLKASYSGMTLQSIGQVTQPVLIPMGRAARELSTGAAAYLLLLHLS